MERRNMRQNTGGKDMGRKDAEKRHTGQRDTEKRHTGQRDTEKRYAGQRDAEKRHTGQRDAEKRRTGQRDAEERRTGQRDAEKRYAEQRNAEKGYVGQRDTEKRYAEQRDTEKRYAGQRNAEKGYAGQRNAEKRHTGQRDAERKNIVKRDTRLCPVASKCGGCSWINKSYEEQIKEKGSRFYKLMEPFGKPEPILAMDDPFYYRNKVHAVFGEDRGHTVISGIYEEKSHCIVPVDRCMIENQKADEIIVSIRGLLKSFKIRPYNEDTGYGLLRHVVVRTGHATGQIMVVLVLASPIMPSKNNFVKALRQIHPEITAIVLNINDRDTSMVLGEKEQVIYGKGYIEDVLCGKTFRISAGSFYQVNSVQTEKLYGKALEYAGLTGRETILDAYCGTGTIGLIASGSAREVIGVELNRDAVRDAVSNAKRNGVSNISFYQNDAGRFLLQMAEQSAKLDVLFMDPPRSGSDEAFLEAAVKIGPKRIIYISCSPETLVRDLRILTKRGYRVEKSVAVDMFPFTESLEAVVSLRKK